MSRIDDKEVRRLLNDLEDITDDVMRDATTFMKSKTPIRSGNARRNTKQKSKTSILADYAYADRLDNGWSKQAPNGFTEPTIEEIETQIYRAVGRL
jgi:hypothetical protein